jgi:hypothetical protein
MKNTLSAILIITALWSCRQKQKSGDIQVARQRVQPKTMAYRLTNTKQWLLSHAKEPLQLQIALALNRTDSTNFAAMDSVLIPDDMSGDLEFYLPFPLTVTSLDNVNKLICFSYATQTFATYEKGQLIYSGPTNMGRKKDPTPTGLFYANWKAEQTTSTFNDEWDLRWNFNIENKEGIGWHQYALPGYPASHSCLRLQEKDARYLYEWADQWVLNGHDSILLKGTPVLVFGSYDFDAAKPWLQLTADPHAIDISENEIQRQISPYLNDILAEQEKRTTAEAAKP